MLRVLRRAWTGLDLDLRTIKIMAKTALPPIVALSAYEADAWAAKYSTLGYLAAVMSFLGMCTMPRAQFIQDMALNILFVCLGTAVALLEIFCVVKARQATTPPEQSPKNVTGASGSPQSVSYNSSASAVAAIWLLVTIYSANTLRAKRPQLKESALVYCILTIVASTYAPQFLDMAAGRSFAKRLIEIFLTGFGIAAGISFSIFPMTSRKIVGQQIGGFLALLQTALAAQGRYLRSISKKHGAELDKDNSQFESDIGAAAALDEQHSRQDHKNRTNSEDADLERLTAATAMEKTLVEVGALFGKIHVELGFAKKEFAYGKLGPDDFRDITLLLRNIMLPVVGMTTFIDLLQSVKDKIPSESNLPDSKDAVEAIKKLKTEEWDVIMAMAHDPFQKLSKVMQYGLTHISYVLEFTNRPKKAATDLEKEHGGPAPGDDGFATLLEEEIQSFEAHRTRTLRAWCERKGIALPTTFWDKATKCNSLKDDAAAACLHHKDSQQQLYLILYLEHLTYAIGQAVLEMVRYADSKVIDGTMKKKRIILPGWKRIQKWIKSVFDPSDTLGADHGKIDSTNIWVGDSLGAKKDPEHLPPNTFLQRSTDYLRIIPNLLSSPESSYGARTAVATLSIGILAYLKPTAGFFIQHRLLWALIMAAISCEAHAGQGIYGFLGRIAGTVISMCTAMAIWYMGDQKAAAVLPLLYIYMFMASYVLVKKPQYIIVGILSIITSVLVVGYELQVNKIGLTLAESNGQPYYPIYKLAPYRLATVVGGLFVAFFWTYIPYPITTHGTLRRSLGSTLYLLGNYYSCVHTTAQMRLQEGLNHYENQKHSPMGRLAKARNKVFAKLMMLLDQLRESSDLTKFEPSFGGKFPKQTYDDLIASMQRMFNYMTLISYSTRTFTHETSVSKSEWLRNFHHFASDLNITSQELTSMLCLVSSSVANRQPLPPYLKPPRPFDLAERMRALDSDILSVQHVSEPCYAAFAVLQVASSLIMDEMEQVVKLVKDLVGEVDFSFHVISTADDSSSMATAMTLTADVDSQKGKRE